MGAEKNNIRLKYHIMYGIEWKIWRLISQSKQVISPNL